jgi:3-hydroxyisobutyrate dehydrogenase-like beta-hydroxyacid dehydrogenase
VLKDLGYAIELAESTDVDPHMAKQAGAYYSAAVEQGIGAQYFPAIIELIGKA